MKQKFSCTSAFGSRGLDAVWTVAEMLDVHACAGCLRLSSEHSWPADAGAIGRAAGQTCAGMRWIAALGIGRPVMLIILFRIPIIK
jgi:hypothetical protein